MFKLAAPRLGGFRFALQEGDILFKIRKYGRANNVHSVGPVAPIL